MKTKKTLFGEFNGQEINLFELSNSNGLLVKVMNYGATITSITIPKGDGNDRIELACGFDTFDGYFSEEYVSNSPYFGCTVGRYCSQIKDAKFSLDGKFYKLANNAGDNNLHGGKVGFDKQVWSAEIVDDTTTCGVLFKLVSPDGDEGFPGQVQVETEMRLNDKNEILINYRAASDKTTPLSLTNHTYFNLTGFTKNIEGHTVKVYSDQLMEMDDSGAATGVINNVSGTINDLRNGRVVGDVHAAIGGGFEHFYVFSNPGGKCEKVAEVSDPDSGRVLEVYSQEPCMLFYSGKYTSDKLQRESGLKYGKFRGFCCETHRYQNGPNIKNSPGTFTTPDNPFHSTTIFRLIWL